MVQKLADGGGRILEVLKSPAAPEAFTYKLDLPSGTTMTKQDDGSLLVGVQHTDRDQVTMEVIGVVGAPWAVDAAGRAVQASYDVAPNGTITMHVAHDAHTQYPVVADPTFTGGGFQATWSIWSPWSVTVYLNKARTADSEDFGAAICIGIAFVPVVGTVIAAICGLHNTLLRTTSRYGYCQKWVVDVVSRSFFVGLYNGGFCS